ncbi:hypothetical protein M3Y94_01064400 [Aphelenchoides besseyi]|nr:hypothetical protein M3Y94_01064400 [Aphelenchoides besseyi]
MERACQSLLFEMLNTHFKPFDKLNLQTKQTILQAISPFFGMFDQCSLTSTTFPEIDDMRYCLHIGQHLHRNQMEKFFSFDPDPSTSIRSSQVLGEHLRILLNKLRTMKIRRSEAAALIGLVLWNEVSLLSFDYATLADQTRNQIFRDLYSDCSKNHADEGAYSRMGSLIFMLKDLNQICQLMLESVTIGRLFSSQPEIFNS